MFGLDKLGKVFGGNGLLGSFFDKIGMPWMNNVMSFAANAMTGNWLAAARDVFSLVSQFSNSWMNSVDKHQPLGQFRAPSCGFGGDSLSNARMDEITARARRGSVTVSRRVTNAFAEVSRVTQNRAYAAANLQTANMASRV